MLHQTQATPTDAKAQQFPAKKGDTIGRGANQEGQKCFWRKSGLAGFDGEAICNVEVILEDGMLVNFTVLHDTMRGFYKTKSTTPRAKVIRRGRNRFGFLFGDRNKPLYYPLDWNHDFEFTVYSMPMKRSMN